MIKSIILALIMLYQQNIEYTINFTKLDLNSAVERAKKEDKNILLIFSMENCEFCRLLEKDLHNLDTSNYIVCIVDTTNDNTIAKSFGVIVYPTSIIVSVSGQQKIIDSNIGYSQKIYKKWLEKNNDKTNNK